MNKIRVCFSLTPQSVKLLNDNKGIATTSAYLDDLIEKLLLKKSGRKKS